ncbi:NepR family anti-sigma factor [Cribrihabitans neustonicus]|uniref:NepR family anti-sigma factor n=1 Tax=Cribrihabitans neustonicus TaxID=1429085 RepID=UPI003B5A4361
MKQSSQLRAHARDKALDREIDENLKKAFDQLASEPVPDRFTELLKQLKEKGPAATANGAAQQPDEEGKPNG